MGFGMRARFAVDQATITGRSRLVPDSLQPLFACDHCTFSPGRRCAWDAGTAGRRHGPAHRAREPVARDGAPAAGRKRPQAVAQGHVVHSQGRRRICRPHGRCARPLCRNCPIPRGRWSASTRARSSSSARCASRSRPSRANSNATITSIAATAPSISSSASTSTGRGARSKSPSGAQPKTTPNACANSPMSIIPTPSASGLSRITCRPTRPAPSTRPLRPPKLGALAPLGVPLHPQACQLAQHGRDRDRRAARSVPGPQNRRLEAPRQRNRRVGTTAKRRCRPHQMDVHNRQSPRQTGPCLSPHVQKVIITVQRY